MTPRRMSTILRELRNERGLTQDELAKRAKVTRSYIAVIERGFKKNPSVPILRRLAKALDVPVARFLE